jgi:hypothetical protein
MLMRCFLVGLSSFIVEICSNRYKYLLFISLAACRADKGARGSTYLFSVTKGLRAAVHDLREEGRVLDI